MCALRLTVRFGIIVNLTVSNRFIILTLNLTAKRMEPLGFPRQSVM